MNRRFYLRHAAAFSASRRRAWAGWNKLPEQLPTRPMRSLSVLDIGCGNARFATFLLDQLPGGLVYEGLDDSAELLSHAEQRLAGALAEGRVTARLSKVRLTGQDLSQLPSGRRYDLVVLFGVLHHIPGSQAREGLLADLAGLLAPEGILVASLWRFDRQPGWPGKILPWESYNSAADSPIDLAELEDGDHLLTWAGDRQAPRYCHLCSEAEAEALVEASALRLRDRFQADGRAGDQNLYLVLGRRGSV